MKTNENPAPRANVGSRADIKATAKQNKASPADWEADATANWFAARFPMPKPLARVLAALARFARAVA